jgi:two-component system nitrate/nitrite response regulator NarL
VAAIRVLIVDDQVLFAEAISPSLRRRRIDVIGVATNGADALDLVRREEPDAVLVDIGLPDQSGLVVGSTILKERPETIVVAVTALEDPRITKRAARAGFQGFLTKSSNLPQFVDSVRSVLEGEMVFPRRPVPGSGSAGLGAGPALDQLTERERQVLALLSRGAKSQTIADALGIAPNTVRTHVQNIFTKLHVHSRLEAVAFVARHGAVAAGNGAAAAGRAPHPNDVG